MGKRNRHANINIAYMGFDILYAFLAYIIAIIAGRGRHFGELEYLLIYVCSITLIVVFNYNRRLYDTTLFFYIDRWLSYITQSCIYSNLIVWVLAFFIGKSNIELSYCIVFFASEYVLLIISAFLTRWIIRRTRTYSTRTLLVGSKSWYTKVLRYLEHNSMSVDIIGYLAETAYYPEGDDTPYLGTIDNLEKVIHENSIDQVFFIQYGKRPINFEQHVELCLEVGVVVRVIEKPYKVASANTSVCTIGPFPATTYHNVVLNVYAKTAKRAFDIVFSIVGIILSAIPMLIIAILIKLDSKGPVIFKQERVGLNGRHFMMYKFRSMVIDAEARKKELESQNKVSSGLMFKIDNDPRITRIGRFIRKTSLDELPQFFNVLFGSMSLVGTRPPTLDEVAQYETRHWRRLSIKPGITGMWQTSGRSEITDFDEVVALDKEYIDNWNMWLDVKILFKTVFQVVLRKKGAQ